MSHIFLSLVKIWVFEYGHNLSFWVLSQFEFLEFCKNLIFWVLSQFMFLSFITFDFLSFATIRFFELSKLECLNLVTICVFEFCQNLSFLKFYHSTSFLVCQNLKGKKSDGIFLSLLSLVTQLSLRSLLSQLSLLR